MLHASLADLILHDLFQYIQTGDPGAVGARKNWLDTTTASAPIWKRRNDANNAWITMSGGGGGDVPDTRLINTTAPLTGGGDLSADRTLGIDDFVGSGASHANGAVPDPGAVAGTTKFLREDGTWAVPPGGGSTGSIKWEPASITTVLNDTELAPGGTGIAAGSGCALSPAYDNSDPANLYMFGMFQLDVTFGTAPTADTIVSLYLVPATDGTNYNDGSATVQPQNFNKGGWNMRAVNTQQRLTISGIPLPPTPFKVMIFNGTNRAFPNSGSTVKMVPYGQAIV